MTETAGSQEIGYSLSGNPVGNSLILLKSFPARGLPYYVSLSGNPVGNSLIIFTSFPTRGLLYYISSYNRI